MFWDKFSVICAEKGVDPNTTAKRVYASAETIAAWRKGDTPSLDKLKRLAKLLDVDINDFLGETEKDLSGKGEFWNGLLAVCRQKGTDPYKLADEMKISLDAVNAWRDGKVPGTLVLSNVSRKLGVHIDDLFYYGDAVDQTAVHDGVQLRFELETVAESLTNENVKTLIDFAEFLLSKQEYDAHYPKDGE